MGAQEFWRDKKRAEETLKEVSVLKAKVETIELVAKKLDECEELLQLARDENDEAMLEELGTDLASVQKQLADLELSLLFSDPDDARDVILAIHPGAGGTESMDWAEMLVRMYQRFCERKGFAIGMLDVTPGEEAGVKSVSMEVKGTNAYGTLKSESGVHRLVRI